MVTRVRCLVLSLALLTVMMAGCVDKVIHVDQRNTSGPWDGSAAHPFKVIQDALDAAIVDGQDVVEVQSGVYAENVVMKAGTTLRRAVKSNPVVVQGAAGSPTIRATDRCTVSGLNIEGGSVAVLLEPKVTVHDGKDGVMIVSNCKIAGGDGIWFKTPNNLAFPTGVRRHPEVRILGNWISSPVGTSGAGTGIRLEITGPTTGELSVLLRVDDNVIQQRFTGVIVETTGQGANPGGFVRALFTGTIANNLIFYCKASALSLHGKNLGSADPTVFNNTIVDNGLHAIVAETTTGPDGDASTHPDIVNNILAGNKGYGYVELGKKTSAQTLNNNVFFQNGQGHYFDEETQKDINTQAELNTPIVDGKVVFGAGGGNLVANPQFAQGDFAWYGMNYGSEKAGAYYLKQTGQTISPAVDAGFGTAKQAGLHLLSTNTDFSPDSGTVDIGFHYHKP